MAGRSKEVSDREILMKFVVTSDPVLVASELADRVGMSRQGVFSRLEELQEAGYLNSAMKSGGRVWWITPEGRDFLSED
jgi:predicted transcriptional regulator